MAVANCRLILYNDSFVNAVNIGHPAEQADHRLQRMGCDLIIIIIAIAVGVGGAIIPITTSHLSGVCKGSVNLGPALQWTQIRPTGQFRSDKFKI